MFVGSLGALGDIGKTKVCSFEALADEYTIFLGTVTSPSVKEDTKYDDKVVLTTISEDDIDTMDVGFVINADDGIVDFIMIGGGGVDTGEGKIKGVPSLSDIDNTLGDVANVCDVNMLTDDEDKFSLDDTETLS